MQPCGLLRRIPRSQLCPSSPSAGAHEHDVTALNRDPCLSFPSLEILNIDRRTRIEVLNAFEPGYICCTVVAVERDGQVATDFPASFWLSSDAALYICGTMDAVARCHEKFPTSR